MEPVDHFLKFFKQLPGLSARVLTREDWQHLLAIEDRDEFRLKVDEYFPALAEKERARMAQFLYDKNEELVREAEEEGGPGNGGDEGAA